MIPEASTGIDTIRVMVRATGRLDAEDEQQGYRLGTEGARWTPRRSAILPCGAYVVLRDGRAWVEGSLPRMMFGSNVYPLPVALLDEALNTLMTEAANVIGFVALDDVVDMVVKRLDLVRNFGCCQELSWMIDGLARLPQQRGVTVGRKGNCDGVSGTLDVSTKTAWSCHLYDKYSESGGLAPMGLARFETRLSKPRLTSQWASCHGGKIEVVGDITEAKVAEMARAMFQHVGFDRTVMTRREVDVIVMTDDRLSEHDKLVLLGWLHAQTSGVPGRLSAVSARKYRGEARRLGITIHPQAEVGGPCLPSCGRPAGARLDWDTANHMVA